MSHRIWNIVQRMATPALTVTALLLVGQSLYHAGVADGKAQAMTAMKGSPMLIRVRQ